MAKSKYKTKKKKSTNKYRYGSKMVEPEVRSNADMGMHTTQGALSGAQLGMQLGGPIGAGVGTLLGGGAALASSMTARDRERNARSQAQKHNQYVDDTMDQANDPHRKVYQAKKGMKSYKYGSGKIEIEGEQYPEIHLDKNYNFKSLGYKKHENGGTVRNATDGDIVINTQNSQEDFNRTMSDIRKYKLKGDKSAKKRLDARVNAMQEFKGGGKYKYERGTTDATPLPASGQTTIAGQESMGYESPISDEVSGTNNQPSLGNNISNQDIQKGLSTAGKFANVARNLYMSTQEADRPTIHTPDLQKYKYTDQSAPMRKKALEKKAIQEYNAQRKVGASGQNISNQAMASAEYLDDITQIENRENRRKQQIENANVDIENQEEQMETQLLNQAEQQYDQNVARKADFGREVGEELAEMSQIASQKGYMERRDLRKTQMDKLRIAYLGTSDFQMSEEARQEIQAFLDGEIDTLSQETIDNLYEYTGGVGNTDNKKQNTDGEDK